MPVEYIAADWPAPRTVVAGTTSRRGGASNGAYASLNLGAHVGDDAACVAANRKRLVSDLALPAEPRWLEQVHGTTVVRTDSEAFADGPPQADAVVCARTDEPIAIMTADCLPLLLCSVNGNEVAAVHCGWRGLASGIVANTLANMTTAPAELVAWLGPAISQRAFEVGDDVRDAFVAEKQDAAAYFAANDNGRWQADLYGLTRLALEAAGVTDVSGGDFCTHGDSARFFSYRRDGQTGRMATFIYRRNPLEKR